MDRRDGEWNEHGRTQIDGEQPAAPQDTYRTAIDAAAPVFTQVPHAPRGPSHPPPADRTAIDVRPTMLPATSAPGAAGARSNTPAQSAPVTLDSGVRVGQFELIRELGRGGMGQVFLARDTKLGRLVALKFLGLQSPQLIERFLVEARATAQCHHENIVVIYEAGEANGLPYMALEYLEGQPLSALLEGRPLSPRRAVELIVPVLRALARAHELGIVHRDLKPDNIFVTRTGQVKVLDFGIAKLFGRDEAAQRIGNAPSGSSVNHMTQHGALIGTMPFMSPEQWGVDEVDHRTDLWAVGIILWYMLAARHPVEPLTPLRLRAVAAMPDEVMPRIEQVIPGVPADLARVIDACLIKNKHQRVGTAAQLLEVLEPLVRGRYGRSLGTDESPFPGMAAFQEADANRFFGRSRDIDHMVQRMRDQALVGVVAPSGVGKSSFVRAGVVPALRASDESWEVLITRPGRDPFAGLATLLEPMAQSGMSQLDARMAEHSQLVARLRAEPGFLGTVLRGRARQKSSRILLFVDQFEELYTLVPDAAERHAYTAALSGMADDPSSPLRVVVSMRSDLLDRAAEDHAFMDRLSAGLLFLPPIDRQGMREALTEPLDATGYRFESPEIVDDMLGALAGSSGALPLLQFTAAKLWEQRDQQRRLLTAQSYQALGGVAGALATHADELLASLPPQAQRLTRAVFQRLVTSEGTRALADIEELQQLSVTPGEVRALLDKLVGARLLVVQGRGDKAGAAVEIVHESLVHRWPTLRRWREESAEDSAFLEQLRTAAKQWDSKGRAVGLLWRGEATDEALRFRRRYKGELAAREGAFLDAVIDLATRAARRKRRLIGGGFVVMAALIVAGAIALVLIRNAERTALTQRQTAEKESERAKKAETEVRAQLATIQQQQASLKVSEEKREEASTAAKTAQQTAVQAQAQAETAESQRKLTYEQLEAALARANREKARAEMMSDQNQKLADSERTARERAEQLSRERQEKINALQKELNKLGTKLD